MGSRVKAFLGRLTNSGLNLPRAVPPVKRWIRCHQCPHLSLQKCSSISRHATNPSRLCPACLPITTSITATTQPTIDMQGCQICKLKENFVLLVTFEEVLPSKIDLPFYIWTNVWIVSYTLHLLLIFNI